MLSVYKLGKSPADVLLLFIYYFPINLFLASSTSNCFRLSLMRLFMKIYWLFLSIFGVKFQPFYLLILSSNYLSDASLFLVMFFLNRCNFCSGFSSFTCFFLASYCDFRFIDGFSCMLDRFSRDYCLRMSCIFSLTNRY